MGMGGAMAVGAMVGMEAAMIGGCHGRRGPNVVVVNNRRRF